MMNILSSLLAIVIIALGVALIGAAIKSLNEGNKRAALVIAIIGVILVLCCSTFAKKIVNKTFESTQKSTEKLFDELLSVDYLD